MKSHYSIRDFLRNLKKEGLRGALKIDWEETKRGYSSNAPEGSRTLDDFVLRSKKESPYRRQAEVCDVDLSDEALWPILERRKVNLQGNEHEEFVQDGYLFRWYGESVEIENKRGGRSFTNKNFADKFTKTGRMAVMIGVCGDGQYILHSQPYEKAGEPTSDVQAFDSRRLVFKYAGGKELVFLNGQFNKTPKEVYEEHHAKAEESRIIETGNNLLLFT